jgi:hypothetical protein
VRRHAVIASLVFVCDAFLWGAPLLWWIGARDRILTGTLVMSEYVGATVVMAMVLSAHLRGAMDRAKPVIDALDAYQAAHGDYPGDLAELTPTYLPKIPRAKYTLWMGEYSLAHAVEDRGPLLLFVTIPPFTAKYFDLKARTWGVMSD